jgi:hypothetical protein
MDKRDASLHVTRRSAFEGCRAGRHRARAVRRQQLDPRTPNLVLRALAVADRVFEPVPVAGPRTDLDSSPHTPKLADPGQLVQTHRSFLRLLRPRPSPLALKPADGRLAGR